MNILSMEGQYLDRMQEILVRGTNKSDRTGTGTKSLFGYQMRCDLRDGFPLITTKKCHLKSIIHELLWFIAGDTNVKYLNDNGVTIWDEWANKEGDLGPVYGKQWRRWSALRDIGGLCDESVADHYRSQGWDVTDPMISDNANDACRLAGAEFDQLAQLMHLLKTDPDSRRLIVSAWNVAELGDMALMPCHVLFQFHTELMDLESRMYLAKHEDLRQISERMGAGLSDEELRQYMWNGLDQIGIPSRYLSCQLYQRSADWFLGVPFNIASYALLTMMVAQASNMIAKDFIHTFGDTHLYTNHLDQAREQLSRKPRGEPRMLIANRGQSLFDFKFDDFKLEGYDPHPSIKAPVAV